MERTMKKVNMNIPDDWPRPWKELGEGKVNVFGYTVMVWKAYKRPAKFSIYGIARGRYTRFWWGRKVVHFIIGLEKQTGD